MSITDKIDSQIETLIEDLVEEYTASGLFSTPTPERKAEIIKQIATIRKSLNPECTCKKN